MGDVSILDVDESRMASFSISWNSQGSYLAAGSSYDRCVKIYSFHSEACRNFCSLKYNTSARVDMVRFHPDLPNLLLASSDDRAIKLWDVRLNNASSKNMATFPLKSNAVSMKWSTHRNQHLFVICDAQNHVHVYDTRAITTSTSITTDGTQPIRSFHLEPHRIYDVAFSPSSTHLVLATKSAPDGIGTLRIFPWDNNHDNKNQITSTTTPNGDISSSPLSDHTITSHITFPGHMAAMTSLNFSPNGRKLVTGGQDSVMALWDVQDMVCTSTSLLRSKTIRSVTCSFDSKVVAGSCYDEDGIDLLDTCTGKNIGTVFLSRNPNSSNRSSTALYGCYEIAFHPKAYVLACARGETGSTSLPALNIATIDLMK